MTQGKGGGAGSRPPDGPVLQIALFIICISDRISVAYRISRVTGWKRNSVFYGYYVLGWLILLLILLTCAPISGILGLAVGWLALYRLQDMLLGTIGDIFASDPYEGSWASKVAVVIVNIIQVVTIFAITFLVFTTDKSFHPSVPPSRFGYFYLSWNSLPPLGSGFAAETLRARILVIIESGAGVLLILIALSRFLGKPGKEPVPLPADASFLCPRTSVPDAPGRDHTSHHGRLSSWMAVAIIITGFIVGGIAMVVGPTWWLFWTGAGIVVIGGILALSWHIFDDWC